MKISTPSKLLLIAIVAVVKSNSVLETIYEKKPISITFASKNTVFEGRNFDQRFAYSKEKLGTAFDEISEITSIEKAKVSLAMHSTTELADNQYEYQCAVIGALHAQARLNHIQKISQEKNSQLRALELAKIRAEENYEQKRVTLQDMEFILKHKKSITQLQEEAHQNAIIELNQAYAEVKILKIDLANTTKSLNISSLLSRTEKAEDISNVMSSKLKTLETMYATQAQFENQKALEKAPLKTHRPNIEDTQEDKLQLKRTCKSLDFDELIEEAFKLQGL